MSTQEDQEAQVIHASRLAGPDAEFGWANPYVAKFWLPILGPTSLWVALKVDEALFYSTPRIDDQRADLNDRELAAAVGLGWGTPLRRSVKRLEAFHCARWEEWSSSLQLPFALPVLPARYRKKLTPTMQSAHDLWMEARHRP